MKKILMVIVIIFLIMFLNPKKEKEKETTITTVPQGQVGIVSHELKAYKIEVIIKNNTNKELKFVKVKADCYDKEGNNLGTESNGQYNINTKDTYKIDIYCDTDTKKYELKLEYE